LTTDQKVSGLNPDKVTTTGAYFSACLFFMAFHTYVLQSLANGDLYKGSTENLERRIIEHNSGQVKYTSRYMPWKLVYCEEYETRSEALAREKFFKTGKGRQWLKEHLTTDHLPKADRFES
jgi:putative endonuclease